MGERTPIPEYADARLIQTIMEAEDCVREGRPVAGRVLLTDGLELAEQHVIAGEPWAGELMNRWRRALYNYLRKHGHSATAELGRQAVREHAR